MSIASLQPPPSAADYDLPPSLAWKHELRARLREHQQRRGGSGAGLPAHAVGGHGASRSSSRVAERVALRYRDAPSYGELLAASADAAAAAAIAAQHAVDAAHLAHAALSRWQADWPEDAHVEIIEQTVVPESLPQWDSESAARGSLGHFEQIVGEPNLLHAPGTSPSGPAQGVRTHAPLPVRSMPPARNSVADPARGNAGNPVDFIDAMDVFAEAIVPAAQGLPAKLIEFPRELIAARKQRPRLAEGPFLETRHQQDPPVHGGDIRIFEVGGTEVDTDPRNGSYTAGIMETVEPERAQAAVGEQRMQAASGQLKTGQRGLRPDRALEASTQSGWAAIHLGEHPSGQLSEHLGAHLGRPFAEQQPVAARSPAARLPEHGYAAESLPALHDLAPVSHRFMAALVDAAIVCFCFLLAVLIFASCAVHLSMGKGAVAVAVLVFCALATFYGWLFMSYGGGSTPGMRYAHIALCTFSDENPRRKDLQNRILATALSLLPLGLGAFWALLDEDKLSWHDRMTRTYQRSYR